MLTFSIQDNYASPSEPTEAMTFSSYGLSAFQVQYWDGSAWQTVSGGSISSNNKVWRKVSFANVTTDRIRIYVTGAADGISRLAEVEAYGYGYDANGNVINDGMHTYQYDSENRLVSVDAGATASYGYDQQNRRYKKTVGSAVTHYVWQGAQVLSEHNGGTGAVQVDYIASGGRMLAKVAGSTGNYFLSDRLSVRLVLDTSGNVVGRQATLPFGEDWAESGTQAKQHFTSYERDSETGTDYAVNRQYNQSVGRFISTDKYQASARLEIPQTWNRYSYVQNAPIDLTDLDGQQGGIPWVHIPGIIQIPIILIGQAPYPTDAAGAGGGGTHGPLEDTGDNSGGSVDSGGEQPDPKQIERIKNACLLNIHTQIANGNQALIDTIRQNVTNGVPPELALAHAAVESSLDPGAIGLQGEIGLFQLKLETANSLGVGQFTADQLKDPALNTQLGTTYLSKLYDKFSSDTRMALIAYKQGEHSLRKNGPSKEAQEYADGILACAQALQDEGR